MPNYGSRNMPTRLSIAGGDAVDRDHPIGLQAAIDTVFEWGWGDGSTAQPTDDRKGVAWIDPTTRRSYQRKRLLADTGGGSTAADVSVEFLQVIHSNTLTLHSSDAKIHDKLLLRDNAGRIHQYDRTNGRWELDVPYRYKRFFDARDFTIPASGGASLEEVAGTNFEWQRLTFADGATSTAYVSTTTPDHTKGNPIVVRVIGSTAATTGNALFRVWVQNVVPGGVVDSSAGTSVDVTFTASGTANGQVDAAGSAASLITGDQRSRLLIKLSRIGADASDTLAADVHVLGLMFEERAYA